LAVFAMFGAACGEVTAQCTTAAQCIDPAAPYCVSDRCQAACGVSADCTDPDRAVCAGDGACVGCAQPSDCGAQAPVCDASERACRGCATDAECSGGVCIEADGTCALDAEVAFVTDMGMDAGACTRGAPCATLTYALAQAGARRVIHVLGGTLSSPGTITLASDLVLDGEDTTLGAPNTTTIAIQGTASVTVEGFRILAPTDATAPAITVTGPARGRLYDVQLSGDGDILAAASGSAELAIVGSHLGSLSQGSANQVNCGGATLRVDHSVLETTIVGDSGACELTVTRNRFESSLDGSVQINGGLLVMENNLVIHRLGVNDSIVVGNLRSGSTIRFNTVVNTTAVPSDGAVIFCDSSVEITSNVFAYNSQHPINGVGCQTRYSVFDDRSLTAAGTGNQVTGIDTIFADRGAGDYHLSATSKARAGAEPGQNMTTVDFDGRTRPDPAGTTADSGAFEAP
jgi:hypothetical protein